MAITTITAYRDGKFCTVEEPEWWALDIADPRRARALGTTFGSPFNGSCYAHTCGEIVESHPISGRPGMIVKIFDGDDTRFVWCIAEADYLDFLTTRVPALMNVATVMIQADSIMKMSTAVVDHTYQVKKKPVDVSRKKSSRTRKPKKPADSVPKLGLPNKSIAPTRSPRSRNA